MHYQSEGNKCAVTGWEGSKCMIKRREGSECAIRGRERVCYQWDGSDCTREGNQ